MSTHERATFSRGREVIEHAVRHLSRVRDALSELRAQNDDGQRLAMFLDSVEVEQRNLLGSLVRLLDHGATEALETYAQYNVEMPTDVMPPGEELLTTLAVLQWLTEQNGYVRTTFAELAEKGDSEEASRVFASIAQQAEAQDRRLSQEYQGAADL